LGKVSCSLIFDHLNRTKNTAGKILEHLRRESIHMYKKDQHINKKGALI
jgi:hypothetical protein